MKVTFVYKAQESLGMLYLMSSLKSAGHDVDLVVGVGKENKRHYKSIVRRIIDTNPDLVAFSCVTDHFQYASHIARELKSNTNIKTIFGGTHVNAVPERVIGYNYVDFICVGEGEESFVELVNELEGTGDDYSKIPGIWYQQEEAIKSSKYSGYIENLDDIPFPDKDGYYRKMPKSFTYFYNIITGRGCPYKCSFCFNWYNRDDYQVVGNKKNFRRRSVENVIDELKLAKGKWKIKQVFFHDDVFTMNKNWLAEFVYEYKRNINIPYRCITHLKMVDKDVAKLLSDTGCKEISVGIQSLNKNVRMNLLNRDDGDNNEMIEKIHYLKDVNIAVDVDHILGIPGEDEIDHIKALDVYNNIRPDRINCLWLVYYPKTELTETARNNSLLSDEEINKIEDGKFSNEDSILSGGTTKNKNKFYGFAFLFNYLPVFPKYLAGILIRFKAYKYLLFKSKYVIYHYPKYISYVYIRKISSIAFIKKIISFVFFRLLGSSKIIFHNKD